MWCILRGSSRLKNSRLHHTHSFPRKEGPDHADSCHKKAFSLAQVSRAQPQRANNLTTCAARGHEPRTLAVFTQRTVCSPWWVGPTARSVRRTLKLRSEQQEASTSHDRPRRVLRTMRVTSLSFQVHDRACINGVHAVYDTRN